MQFVIDKLIDFSKQIDLSSRFNWTFNGDLLNSIPSVGPFINIDFSNTFERNEALKFKLTEYFQQQNPPEAESLNFWIINEWGGIKNFKSNDANIKRIRNFSNEIRNGKMTRSTFSTISSLSKLGSFWDCNKFAIYDSRAIYSFNWLILKYSNEKRYFPTPAGRSQVISNYSIDTIIRLYHKGRNKPSTFFSYKEAYHKYCQLLNDLSLKVWDAYPTRRQYPFYLEMLLFVIADKEIYDDMIKSINLEIN